MGQLLRSFKRNQASDSSLTKCGSLTFCPIVVELHTVSVLLLVELFKTVISVENYFSVQVAYLAKCKKQLRSVQSILSFFKIISVLSQTQNYFKKNVEPSSHVKHSI